jgi:ABC-2 type transport system permease protein
MARSSSRATRRSGPPEGHLVTPVTKLELIMGFNLSGTIKAVLSSMVLMTVGALVAGIPIRSSPCASRGSSSSSS